MGILLAINHNLDLPLMPRYDLFLMVNIFALIHGEVMAMHYVAFHGLVFYRPFMTHS